MFKHLTAELVYIKNTLSRVLPPLFNHYFFVFLILKYSSDILTIGFFLLTQSVTILSNNVMYLYCTLSGTITCCTTYNKL